MEIKDRIKRSLEIEKEGDIFVSVVKKEFDFADDGYFTNQEQRMKILTPEFLDDTITQITARINKIDTDVTANDEFLASIETKHKKHWESKEFNVFMKNYEKKYSKLLKWKNAHDEFMKKQIQNTNFRTELEVEREFLEHYSEMKEQWDK